MSIIKVMKNKQKISSIYLKVRKIWKIKPITKIKKSDKIYSRKGRKKKDLFLPFLLIILTVGARLLSSNLIKIYPLSPLPGDTLIITLNLNPNYKIKKANCALFGKLYPFYSTNSEGNLQAMVGITPKITPGEYVVKNYIKTKDRSFSIFRKIVVKKRRFSEQRLKISAKKRRLYSHPKVKEEYRKISKALRSENEVQYWEGDFIMPVPGRITTEFGMQRIINNVRGSYHKGVDIAASRNTPILASNRGIITLTANFRLHGKTVIINHGQGISTLYLHLNKILVREGDMVEKGEEIGLVGDTGVSTAPHLHWGLYIHAEAVDPLQFIRILHQNRGG